MSDRDIDSILAESGLSQEDRASLIEDIGRGAVPADIPEELLIDEAESRSFDLRKLIESMPVSQKIKLALFGGAGARQILVFDSNRIVQILVLKNPRMTDIEIEGLAQNKNVSEHVLRGISDNKSWTKHYNVKLNLASNPKTPADLSLKWLKHLHAHDLKRMSQSRELPQVVSSSARRRLGELGG